MSAPMRRCTLSITLSLLAAPDKLPTPPYRLPSQPRFNPPCLASPSTVPLNCHPPPGYSHWMLSRFMSLGASRQGTPTLLENFLSAPGQLLCPRSLCASLDNLRFLWPISSLSGPSCTIPGRASLKSVCPASPDPLTTRLCPQLLSIMSCQKLRCNLSKTGVIITSPSKHASLPAFTVAILLSKTTL